MTPEEIKQVEDSENHFNRILPINLPKNRKVWKLIDTLTALKTLKPLCTIMVHSDDKYILKVMEAFRIMDKFLEAEKEYVDKEEYDLTIGVKRGTNIISFTKSKEDGKQWYCMYCIPLNDMKAMDKVMADIAKQGNPSLMLLIKQDISNFNL